LPDEKAQNFDLTKTCTNEMDVFQFDGMRPVAEDLWFADIRIDILVDNAAIDPRVKSDQGALKRLAWRDSPLISGILTCPYV